LKPWQWRSPSDEASIWEPPKEELIRFSAPVPHATFRVTTEPVDLEGVQIPARKQVLICLGAAGRDPNFYDNPAVLDIARESRPHLGFGHGIHFCLGAPLARLEGRIAFGALLRRFPKLRLAVDRDELRWTHGDGLVLRGLDSLPVRLGAADTAHPAERSTSTD
jgi:cytochrome P450